MLHSDEMISNRSLFFLCNICKCVQEIKNESVRAFVTHVCPISWAIVKAVPRPMSSLMLQLLSGSHIPPTGARPAEMHSMNIKNNSTLKQAHEPNENPNWEKGWCSQQPQLTILPTLLLVKRALLSVNMQSVKVHRCTSFASHFLEHVRTLNMHAHFFNVKPATLWKVRAHWVGPLKLFSDE